MLHAVARSRRGVRRWLPRLPRLPLRGGLLYLLCLLVELLAGRRRTWAWPCTERCAGIGGPLRWVSRLVADRPHSHPYAHGLRPRRLKPCAVGRSVAGHGHGEGGHALGGMGCGDRGGKCCAVGRRRATIPCGRGRGVYRVG